MAVAFEVGPAIKAFSVFKGSAGNDDVGRAGRAGLLNRQFYANRGAIGKHVAVIGLWPWLPAFDRVVKSHPDFTRQFNAQEPFPNSGGTGSAVERLVVTMKPVRAWLFWRLQLPFDNLTRPEILQRARVIGLLIHVHPSGFRFHFEEATERELTRALVGGQQPDGR